MLTLFTLVIIPPVSPVNPAEGLKKLTEPRRTLGVIPRIKMLLLPFPSSVPSSASLAACDKALLLLLFTP